MSRLILRCLGVMLWMLEILMQWVLTPVGINNGHVSAAIQMSRELRAEINMESKIETVRDTTENAPGS